MFLDIVAAEHFPPLKTAQNATAMFRVMTHDECSQLFGSHVLDFFWRIGDTAVQTDVTGMLCVVLGHSCIPQV